MRYFSSEKDKSGLLDGPLVHQKVSLFSFLLHKAVISTNLLYLLSAYKKSIKSIKIVKGPRIRVIIEVPLGYIAACYSQY